MFLPLSLLVTVAVLFAGLAVWTTLLARGRNPLPFPDRGSRIFTAASPEAKEAIVALLTTHGIPERFQFNSAGVARSILWDGTIVNYPTPEMHARLGNATASIGLVADDPTKAAEAAALLLKSRGFTAQIVADAEPELPIVFVLTNALPGTALNFRRHVIHLPRPTKPARHT